MLKKYSDFYYEYKVILFPGVVAISALILIVFVIYPQFTNLLNNRKEQEVLTERLRILEVKAEELQSLSSEDLKQKLNLALIALPIDRDYTTIIGIIQQFASLHNFSLLSMQFGNMSSAKESNNFSVDLQVAGPKQKVNELLSDLESASRVMKLSGLDSTTSSDQGEFVTLSLTLDIFYAQLPNAIGAVDSPVQVLTENDVKILNKLASMRTSSSVGPANLLPRGKPNPFE